MRAVAFGKRRCLSVRMSLIKNKKVRLQYEIIETLHAGAVLTGSEVKSLRAGKGKLEGGRVVVRGGEAYVVGVSIPLFQQHGGGASYEPEHPRKLLLSKKEIMAVYSAEQQKGLTCIPISWYNKKKHIKLEIAIVRGKKKEDRRHDLKKRTQLLEARREASHR